MSFDMTPQDYKTLYARFSLGTQPQDFINLAGGIKDKTVLDLCCGDGRITKLCSGAKAVYAVDVSLSMTRNIQKTENLHIYYGFVQTALTEMAGKDVKADIVFCQQAINYWLDEVTSKKVYQVMAPGGFFIFNTFNVKPDPIPKVNEYVIGNKEYVEVSWSVNDTVHHVQCCLGYPPHVTEFAWISPYRFRTLLEPYFVTTEVKNGRGSVYCCQRKS